MRKPAASVSAAPSASATPSEPVPGKKKRHRAGKNRKKSTRQSFDATTSVQEDAEDEQRASMAQPSPFYRLQSANRSNTSLESEALMDHREHQASRPRRRSLLQNQQASGFARPSLPFGRHRGSGTSALTPTVQRSRLGQGSAIEEDEEEHNATDRTPLIAASHNRTRSRPQLSRSNSGQYGSTQRVRRSSANSKNSSRKLRIDATSQLQPYVEDDEYDVNNPPSVPTSPKIGSLDDIMINDYSQGSPDRGRDMIIDIDGDDRRFSDSPGATRRRATVADLAERDVCFPGDAGMSELGEDEETQSRTESRQRDTRRARGRRWPDLSLLEDWAREEKEERTHQEHVRAKKINEPVIVNGRLRPGKTVWHREEDDEPFRFTYFNEMFDGTIHARTISDLCQEGTTFEDLFLPPPPELAEDSEGEEENDNALERPLRRRSPSAQEMNGGTHGEQQAAAFSDAGSKRSPSASKSQTRSPTPSEQVSQAPTPRPYQKSKRYGPRPTFWLDVLQPTDNEMKVLAKTFGIHQLTTEDILMEEQREKVELFQNYYFVNYRSFEQDKDSEDYMEPVNFYVVVFRDGVITFHHSQTPHPANVRRRIRQLNDYMSPTADWVSYAIIDDVTDVYAPRVSQIEQEVDDIDEEILYLHVTSADHAEGTEKKVLNPENDDRQAASSGGDMLRRIGECRKTVMGLYRLLGNKADVIKGFAKRCNESWEVAPRSEIGLYLGDIQDHIVTMNNNLGHYEK